MTKVKLEKFLGLPLVDGYVLSSTAAGVRTWVPVGTGSVVGPGTSTDKGIARYSGTDGQHLQDSLNVRIADDGTILAGQTASTTNYSNAKLIGSNGASGLTSIASVIGVCGEAAASVSTSGRGLYGSALSNGSNASYGVYGQAKVNASADTAWVYGVYGLANDTHSGGVNYGVYGSASNSSYENVGVYGTATAVNGSSYLNIAVLGSGVTNGASPCPGIYGSGVVTNTNDTATAYGGYFIALATHAGGQNTAIYANASGGTAAYSFYGAGGLMYNSSSIGIAVTPTISDGVGLHIAGKIVRLDTAKTPATSGATGNAGEICWDANYIYVCTAANTWKRAAIATW